MLVYAGLLIPLTIVPSVLGEAGITAGVVNGALSVWFMWHAVRVWRTEGMEAPRRMFRFSILYLFLVFVVLLVDRAITTLL